MYELLCIECLRYNSSTILLITPPLHRPRSNKTATPFTPPLCFMLSGDGQLNRSHSKYHSCKKKQWRSKVGRGGDSVMG